MTILKALATLALGSAILAGCGAKKDESAAQTETPAPAAETTAPAPADPTYPGIDGHDALG